MIESPQNLIAAPMQPAAHLVPRDFVAVLALASIPLLLSTAGCDSATSKSKSTDKGAAPAKVEKLPHEADLTTITLTSDAERRLGVTTREVERKSVARHRTLSGQVMVPAGKTIVVSSPLAGQIARADDDSLPTPGDRVSPDQPLLVVKPLLSAERDVPTPAEKVQIVGAKANLMAARTVAAGDVQRSQAEVDAAKINLDRANQLFADRAGAKRSVDDAEAQLNIATSKLEAAKQREKQLSDLLAMLEDDNPDGEATALPMTTPIPGILNRIEVREGQTISSGSVLFEVVNIDTAWIRVPVFVDQLPDIDTGKPVHLVRLSGQPIADDVTAKPIAAPPTADALASTADLYYELDNSELHLRPGQRVGVKLPTTEEDPQLVVPNAAVLYDIYGNTWVYTKTADRQYTRSRVEIRYVDGENAVLASGPTQGTPVVVDGAAELFGTEFGVGK